MVDGHMAAIIDIGVILILLISAGVAFFRGFIREVLTIVGVIGGGLAALMFGKSLTPLTRSWFGVQEDDPRKIFDLIPYEFAADASAYLGIFLIVFIILQLASHFFSSAVRALGLGPVDRTLGFAFGLARGLLLLGVLYLPFYATSILGEKEKNAWFGDSKTFFYVEATAKWLSGFLPNSKEEAINSTREKLKKLDVLENEKAVEETKEPVPEPEDGYTNQQRQSLDFLIEDRAQPNAAPSREAPKEPRHND